MRPQIISSLKQLQLHGMAASFPEVAAQARHTDFNPESFMHQLILSESAERSVRSTAYQMGAVRFAAHRDLAGFAFAEADVDELLVRKLHSSQFTQEADTRRSLVDRASARRTWLRPLASRRFKSMASGCVSSLRWSWSTHWSRKKQMSKLARLP